MNAFTIRAIGVACLVFGVIAGVGLLLLDVVVLTFSPGPGVDFLAMMLPLPHAFCLYMAVCGLHALTEPRRDGQARFVKEPVGSGWRVRLVRSKRRVSVPAALLFVSCLVVNVGCVAIAIWGSVPPWWASAIQGLPGLLLVALLWWWLPPDRWLEVDEPAGVVRWVRHRPRERFEVPLSRVIGVGLRIGEPTPLGRGNFAVVLHWRDDETLPREAELARFGKYDDAEALAGWIRERLGLGAGPHPPSPSP